MAIVTTTSYADRIEEIRPVIEEHAPQTEADRHLAEPIYGAMLDAGLFRLLAPTTFGGDEVHPVVAYEVWEAIARIDSAAGWNLQIAAAAAGFAAWLPAEGSAEIYAEGPDLVVAGGVFPPGGAVPVDGGWHLSGRTPFVSGCRRADWFLMPAVEMEGGEPKVDPATGQPSPMAMFLRRDDVEILDTWHTVGMRGTGSADVVVDGAFVPAHRVAPVAALTDPTPAYAAPLYRTMPWPGVHGETTVSLGIAAAAIDKLVALATDKVPAFGVNRLRDRELAQHHAAKATALLDSARLYLHDSIRVAVDEAASGPLSQATKHRCQLAACWAAEAGAQAVDLVHEAAGTTSIRLEGGIERHFRDIHVLTQHASKSVIRYQDVGKQMFGLPQDWFILNL